MVPLTGHTKYYFNFYIVLIVFPYFYYNHVSSLMYFLIHHGPFSQAVILNFQWYSLDMLLYYLALTLNTLLSIFDKLSI